MKSLNYQNEALVFSFPNKTEQNDFNRKGRGRGRGYCYGYEAIKIKASSIQ